MKKQTYFKNHPLLIPSACKLYQYFGLKFLVSYLPVYPSLQRSNYNGSEETDLKIKKPALELAPPLLAIFWGRSLTLFALASSCAK